MHLALNLLLDWLGVALAYVIAAALIAGGGYLAFMLSPTPFGVALLGRVLRYCGAVLMLAGLALGLITFGKGLGLEACAAASREAELRAEISKLKTEAALKDAASMSALSSMQTLARLNDDAQKQVGDYRQFATGLAACRRATGDDDRRLRAILESDAPAR